MINFFFFISAFCFSSCGYHFREVASQEAVASISVPYIEGDMEGKLTACIIKELATHPSYQYKSRGASCFLHVEVIKNEDEQVGYRHDRLESTAALLNRLVPVEGRKKMRLRAQLQETGTGKVLAGPFEVSAYKDYDFVNFDTYKELAFVDIQNQPFSTLAYSLGQLDSIEGAKEAAIQSVYIELAKKLLLGLEN